MSAETPLQPPTWVGYMQSVDALSAEAVRLRAEVERLRAGIEALAAEGEAWGKGVAVHLSRRLRALLATPEAAPQDEGAGR